MKLHELLDNGRRIAYRWYSAFNERPGRFHAWQVPCVKRRWLTINARDAEALEQEGTLNEYLERVRSQWTPRYYVPTWFRQRDIEAGLIPNTRRLCNRTQVANEWEIGYDNLLIERRMAQAPYGYCETCWRRMTELPENVILGAPRGTLSHGAPLAVEDPEEFYLTMEGYIEGRHNYRMS